MGPSKTIKIIVPNFGCLRISYINYLKKLVFRENLCFLVVSTSTPHLEFHCDPSSKLKVEAAVEDQPESRAIRLGGQKPGCTS